MLLERFDQRLFKRHLLLFVDMLNRGKHMYVQLNSMLCESCPAPKSDNPLRTCVYTSQNAVRVRMIHSTLLSLFNGSILAFPFALLKHVGFCQFIARSFTRVGFSPLHTQFWEKLIHFVC